jgi:small subunit ribosomal protein S8
MKDTKKDGSNDENIAYGQITAGTEVLLPRAQSLPAVRSIARLLPQIQDLPHLPAKAGLGRIDSRHAQGQLVTAQEENDAMSMTDPIADMLTRIRNAVRVKKAHVDVPYSRIKAGVLDVLEREGFITGYDVSEPTGRGMLRVALKYSRLGESVIQAIQRASKPGLRKYAGADDLEPVLRGVGISVVSTSHGVLSDRECRDKKVGGEVLCTVY